MEDSILIAYYSWHGNTRKIAKLVASAIGGTLFEIEPIKPYSTDYGATVAQAKEEIQSGFLPELKAMPTSTSYDVVLVGTPIWCHTMAPPVASFVNRLDLDGKTVIPFYTHGGGGVGSFEKDIAEMCPNSTVPEGFGTVNTGGPETPAEINSWWSTVNAQT